MLGAHSGYVAPMTKYLVGFAVAVALVGCGETPVTTTDSGVTKDSGVVMTTDSGVTPVDSGTVVTDAGTKTDAGTGATDAGTAMTCAIYCAAVTANCTGANAQYVNLDSCLGSCAGLSQGNIGATAGNNLECRGYHAGAPAQSNAGLHCPHAGPSGAGTCGSDCEGFCAINLAACTGGNVAFATLNDCTTACTAFPSSAITNYNDSTTSGNTYACRMYHLSVAATAGGAQAATHCSHTKTASAPCQ